MIAQILGAVFLFGLCIFFHELGHYLLGKFVGIQPKIFSIGYGKGLWFKKVGRTIYQVTAIPLGGYVQFYGDDPTKEHKNLKKGDFFEASPWRRIIVAFGGPLFSILLGFIVIFFLIVSGWQPTKNKIRLVKAENPLPAQIAGLKDGDRILAVNGEETDSFEKVQFKISLAGSPRINLKVERAGKVMNIPVIAREGGAGQYAIGVRAYGRGYIAVLEDKQYKKSRLKKEDFILSVNGTEIVSRLDLEKELNANQGKNVTLEVRRKSGGFFSPSGEETFALEAPVNSKEELHLVNVYDTQTKKTIPQIKIGSWEAKSLAKIFIGEQSFSTWPDLKKAINAATAQTGRINMRIGYVNVIATPQIKSRGLLGIKIGRAIIPAFPEKAEHSRSFGGILARTYDQTVFSTQSTILGLWRLIQGKLSFRDSVSGPVKIFAFAFREVKSGWDRFWFLLAQITIILGIMNLLPIPVLDGGHIIFYLIEGIYKPLPTKIIAGAVRLGMVALLSLGAWVIFIDVWDLVTGRF